MKEKVNKLTNPMLTHYLTLLRVTQDTQITRNWTKEHNSQKIINYKSIFNIGHTFKFKGGGRKNPRKQESEFPVDMHSFTKIYSVVSEELVNIFLQHIQYNETEKFTKKWMS